MDPRPLGAQKVRDIFIISVAEWPVLKVRTILLLTQMGDFDSMASAFSDP